MNGKISVSQPLLDESELRHVSKALRQGAISGFYGEAIEEFETGFARFSDCKHGIAVSSGTTALHVALTALGIGNKDEVLVSTLTNMATCFAILYQNAIPVPIDIERDTWNLDPNLLEARLTPRTKAILVVHLFGHPVDMDPVMKVARRSNLRVIEDCAEAHGAEYKGKKVGSIGDVGCFSFYANKIITTGEGGMCTTNNASLAAEIRSLKSLAFGAQNKFMHRAIGYNYRMTNLQAALGCAQLEKIHAIIGKKRAIARLYNKKLGHIGGLQLPVEKEYARNVYWMYHLALKNKAAEKRALVMQKLSERGIESREGFIPYNMQEIILQKGLARQADCPLANDVAFRGFYLPTGAGLSEEEVEFVAKSLGEIIQSL